MDVSTTLTILIVEDDHAACQAYRTHSDECDDIRLVGVTGYADKALELIRDHLPQAIILDLELQKGSGSGLDVLNGITQMQLAVNPFVLIVTNNVSAVIQRRARQYENLYIISKHQRDYSEKHCLDFLRGISEDIQEQYHNGSSKLTSEEPPAQQRDRLVDRIHAELNNVYINHRVLGYKYLTDGILMTMQAPRQNLCEELAKQYGKSTPSVIRAMENAIKRAWRIADIDALAVNYTARIIPEKGVPTLMEFVTYYADKLKKEYQM